MDDPKADVLSRELAALLPEIPMLSIQGPPGWEYEPISIVTAQSVTGTGLLSNLTSFVTDALGRQSGLFIEKLQEGEGLCRNSLRMQALMLGCDAIMGVDADYAEIGGTKAMLMVCMTGTAVKLKSYEMFDAARVQRITNARQLASELDRLMPKTRQCSFCSQRVTEPLKPCDSAGEERLREVAPRISSTKCREALRARGYL